MKPFYDRPCAAPGLASYRYPSAYGWIMIGALCIRDALREADRSLSVKGATADRLEIWDSESACYVPVMS